MWESGVPTPLTMVCRFACEASVLTDEFQTLAADELRERPPPMPALPLPNIRGVDLRQLDDLDEAEGEGRG